MLKQSQSSNDKKLTANKNEVVLSQQKSEKQPQETFSVSLYEKRPSLSGKEKPTTDVKASPSPKTPDITSSGIEGKKSEEKHKVKKSLSPSLSALIEKDAKNCQKGDKPTEDKNVEVKPNESSGSKSVEPLDSWGAFELKLQNKVKKSAEKPKRVIPNTRGNHDTRGSPEKRGSDSENVTILIEDSPKTDKELKNIGRTVSTESRDSKDGKVVSPERIEMSSTAVGRNLPREEHAAKTQVKLSVNGDQITIPSVRARKNSFLSSEDEASSGKATSERARVPSFSLNDDPKTIVIQDSTPKHSNAMKTGHEISQNRERIGSFHDEQNTVIIENDIRPHSLTTKETSVSRTVSQSSTHSRGSNSSEGKNKRVLNLSREASLESTASRTRSSSFERSKAESLTGSKIGQACVIIESGKEKDIEISESLENSKSNDENVGQTSGQAAHKTLADLLAKDDTSSQDSQGRTAPEQSQSDDTTNLYKDKLKGLKRTTTYYASSEPITLGSSGNRKKADSSSLQNGLDTSTDKTSEENAIDVNNNLEKKEVSHSLSSRNEVFKSDSIESNSSQKNILPVGESKREFSGQVVHIPSGGPTVGMIV
jgi:hypothetical protein